MSVLKQIKAALREESEVTDAILAEVTLGASEQSVIAAYLELTPTAGGSAIGRR